MATKAKTKTKRPAKTARATGNIHDREYEAFLTSLSFSIGTSAGAGPIFQTDVDPEALWKAYLRAFAPADWKFHDCSACRGFIKRFGGLVTIGEDGRATPLVWMRGVPKEYEPAFAAARKCVSRAAVKGVFYSKEHVLGTPTTGIWRHMAALAPGGTVAPHAGPKMAEKREDFTNVLRALEEFPLKLVERAIEVLDTAVLYRGEKVLGQAIFLRDLHVARRDAGFSHLRENLTWRAIANAPAGFCHPRSSMIGTLLEDLASGASVESAKARFEAKMDPLKYLRPTVVPSAQNVMRAEKLVEELGIARALERRFARLDEVEALWSAPVPAR
ncbi:MAG: hypothetical protein ACJ8AT_39270, partial [Hyalangium sp.]|uniref:hypothetical protein n=1 Tax=Hyalangium sp. TaxID=2028555 RepID=UPI00389A3EDA